MKVSLPYKATRSGASTGASWTITCMLCKTVHDILLKHTEFSQSGIPASIGSVPPCEDTAPSNLSRLADQQLSFHHHHTCSVPPLLLPQVLRNHAKTKLPEFSNKWPRDSLEFLDRKLFHHLLSFSKATTGVNMSHGESKAVRVFGEGSGENMWKLSTLTAAGNGKGCDPKPINLGGSTTGARGHMNTFRIS